MKKITTLLLLDSVKKKIQLIPFSKAFLFCCLIKIIISFFVYGTNMYFGDGKYFLIEGDTLSYTEPIDNLLKYGNYVGDKKLIDSYAGRMPAVGAVYLCFRLFLNPLHSMVAYCLAQYLCSFVSMYLVGKIMLRLDYGKYYAFIAMMLFALSTFLLKYDVVVLGESFAVITVLSSFYFICKVLNNRRLTYVFFIGVTLAIAVFFRPFLVLIFPAVGFYLIWHFHTLGEDVKRILLMLSIFSLPFIILDSLWVARNWPIYKRIIPLQSTVWAGYDTKESYKSLVGLCTSLGYEAAFWERNSAMDWFVGYSSPNPKFVWSQNDFTRLYNMDTLQVIKETYRNLPLPSKQNRIQHRQDSMLVNRINAYKDSYKEEKPVRYHIINRIKILYILVFKNAVAVIFTRSFSDLPMIHRIFKVLSYIFYVLTVGLGFISVLFIWKHDKKKNILVKIVPLYTIIIIGIVFQQPEQRYFAVAYPFMLINFAITLKYIGVYFKNHGFVNIYNI
ncbi:glycosyltransferase family 39 protein [Hymenobacter sublimis]|uniref:Glycosyltransferase family 39 protein n=1 Tax=Hymenobacter sublimis TaxID=2933777 RepID=A0ABY4JBJ1_9BACT|nr:glycosyltransferase family 39 protein [Hymenobacter sublimis]UPL49831.1 glycosyltransferase family 39 protein [Hymenobacter sublimis]